MNALKTLNPYFYKHKKLIILGIFFVCFSNLLTIYPIKFVGLAVNIIAENITQKHFENNSKSYLKLIKYGAIIIVAPILSGIMKFYMRQTIIVTSRKIEFELKNNIYKHYQTISLSFFKKSKVGDLINRISEDVVNVRQYLGPGIMYSINLSIMLIILLFYMIKTDLLMTLFALLPLPFLSYIIYKQSFIINKKTKKVQEEQSEISSFAQESFSGIRVIKSFVKEDYFISKYNRLSSNYKQGALSLAITESLFSPLMILLIGLSNIFILYIGGQRYINGKISIGTITDFFLYLNILIWPFTALGWVISIIRKAQASMERINQFLNIPEEIINKNHAIYPIKGEIIFDKVSYTYPNTGIKALDEVSFKIKPGETIVIMGKTGSGKTTLALLLERLIETTSGTIYIDMLPIQDHNLTFLRDNIGYVPQENFLFADSIYNNIAYGVDNPTKEQVIKVAKQAKIYSNIMDFPDNFETLIGERGVTLSGGQKQRISIARALIRNPILFIFDDSLSALDTETEEKILMNVEKEVKQKTTIIMSHRISAAKNADKIIIMDKGKIIEMGSHEELIELKGYYTSLYNKQLRK